MKKILLNKDKLVEEEEYNNKLQYNISAVSNKKKDEMLISV